MSKASHLFLVALCFWLLLPLHRAEATPAYPKPGRILQSDGTYLTTRLYGDEFFHYRTTEDGYPISSKNGLYYHVNYRADGTFQFSAIRAANPAQRSSAQRAALLGMSKSIPMAATHAAAQRAAHTRSMSASRSSGMSTVGKKKAIVILCNYVDVKFQTPKSHYETILNGAGKTAKQYFRDSSYDQFDPQFDIYGPVELPQNRAYYGGNNAQGSDMRPQQMCIDAVAVASRDLGVNMRDYDTDGDGFIDQVFLYFAGQNEAEYGPEETIWPHRWSVFNTQFFVNGVRLWDYACASELSTGGDGRWIPATIGTLCHEFSHVLGLSDLYDTNGATGGESPALGYWSLMSAGNYLDNGRTPPSFNAFERYQANWLTPQELQADGAYTLNPINQGANAYLFNTKNTGEFFLMENRVLEGWDYYLPQGGMLVYRIDMSNNRFVQAGTARELWPMNQPNAWADHQCMYLIKANGKEDTMSGLTTRGTPFPGSTGRTFLDDGNMNWANNPHSLSWNRKRTFNLSNIRQEGNQVKFDFVNCYNMVVTGVEFDKEVVQLSVGETVELKATVLPRGVENTHVKWSIAPEGIATVSDRGVINGILPGKATVTVTTEENQLSASCQVEVTIPAPVSLKVTKAQSDALVAWSPGGSEKKWVVEWIEIDAKASRPDSSAVWMPTGAKPVPTELIAQSSAPIRVSNRETQRVLIDAPNLYITDLTPATRYLLRIQAYVDEHVRSYFAQTEFTTNNPNSAYPALNVKGTLKVGEKLYFGTSNLPPGATTVWKVNGKRETASELTLPAGEHEIRLEITDASGTEVILKYITVK